MSDTDTAYRNHLFAPIPELLQAARLLQQAVEAHIALRDPRDQPVARAVAFQEWDGLTSIFQSKAG